MSDFMLMGEYHHNLDSKGRIIIPSKFRSEFTNEVVITRGIDECLFIYSKNEWDNIMQNLKSLPFTKKDTRSFMRIFLSGAIICEFDKQGRINITQPLLDYASINKECVIVGVGDRLELWSSTLWNDFINSNKENLSTLAEHLLEGYPNE